MSRRGQTRAVPYGFDIDADDDPMRYFDEDEDDEDDEHDCLDCLNCDEPDSRMGWDGIGYCTKYFEFVDLLDSDLDKNCESWEHR